MLFLVICSIFYLKLNFKIQKMKLNVRGCCRLVQFKTKWSGDCLLLKSLMKALHQTLLHFKYGCVCRIKNIFMSERSTYLPTICWGARQFVVFENRWFECYRLFRILTDRWIMPFLLCLERWQDDEEEGLKSWNIFRTFFGLKSPKCILYFCHIVTVSRWNKYLKLWFELSRVLLTQWQVNLLRK